MAPRALQFRPGIAFSNGVPILAAPLPEGAAQPNPRWIHVANEGKFEGYPAPGGAEITRAMLEQMVLNFRSHPQFKADGSGKVCPFDVAHVSEMDPRIGDPAANEKAYAWAVDLQIRDGADGKAQLWALTKLGDEVKGMIERGEMKYVSIAFTPSMKHPVTAAEMGAVMTSVAFTNKPFIRDLTPLAASQEAARFLGVCRAESPDDALAQFRSILRLPLTAAPAEVLGQIVQICEMAAAGKEPPGVDVDDILEDAKAILNVPVLATPAQIAAATRAVLATVLPSPTTTPGGQPAMNDQTKSVLFKIFGLNAAAADADEAIVAMAREFVEMKTKLTDLLTAAGFGNLADLVKAVPDLLKAKTALGEHQAQLDAALKQLAGYQEQEQIAEVAAVMSVHKLPDLVKPALMLSLKTDAKAFRAQYPIPDETRKHLLTTFAAGRQGEVQPPAASTEAVTMSASQKSLPADAIDLRTFSGRNTVERAIAYLSSKDESFKKLEFGEQCKRAGLFCRENHARIVTL